MFQYCRLSLRLCKHRRTQIRRSATDAHEEGFELFIRHETWLNGEKLEQFSADGSRLHAMFPAPNVAGTYGRTMRRRNKIRNNLNSSQP